MTRERLENLSFEELLKLADKENMVVPDDIDKDALIDMIQEILAEEMAERCEFNNPSMRIEELKYHISQDEEIEIRDGDDEFQIPQMYNKTRVVFMPRDPYWAFAYWELEPKKQDELEKDPEFGGLFLRVHDVTGIHFNGSNSNNYFDIPIQLNDDNWYINVPNPNSSYILELYYVLNNEDVLLTRSNLIHIPKDEMAEPGDEAPPEGVQTDQIIDLTHEELFRLPSSWGPIPQRIISFINLKYLRQNE